MHIKTGLLIPYLMYAQPHILPLKAVWPWGFRRSLNGY